MSLAEQRQLAHNIRREMGLPPDEDLEALKVILCFSLSQPLRFSAKHALPSAHAVHAHMHTYGRVFFYAVHAVHEGQNGDCRPYQQATGPSCIAGGQA